METESSTTITESQYNQLEYLTAMSIRSGKLGASDFCEFVMRDKDGIPFELSEMHTTMHRFVDECLRKGFRLIAIQSHMESGKTQMFGVARPLFEIGRSLNTRIGLCSANDKLATERVAAIKRIIEHSDRFHLTFPDVKPSNKWTEKTFVVRRKKGAEAMTDPTVRAGGIASGVMGSRYDWLFFDDP